MMRFMYSHWIYCCCLKHFFFVFNSTKQKEYYLYYMCKTLEEGARGNEGFKSM